MAKIDGVDVNKPSTSKKEEYKRILQELMQEEYEHAAGIFVIPVTIATTAGLKMPKKQGTLISGVSSALTEMGYMGGYHGENLVLKEVKVTEVDF